MGKSWEKGETRMSRPLQSPVGGTLWPEQRVYGMAEGRPNHRGLECQSEGHGGDVRRGGP